MMQRQGQTSPIATKVGGTYWRQLQKAVTEGSYSSQYLFARLTQAPFSLHAPARS